jgi:hypothetical protein
VREERRKDYIKEIIRKVIKKSIKERKIFKRKERDRKEKAGERNWESTNPYGILAKKRGEKQNTDRHKDLNNGRKKGDRSKLARKGKKIGKETREGKNKSMIGNLLSEKTEKERRVETREEALVYHPQSQVQLPYTKHNPVFEIMSSPSGNRSPKRMRVEGLPELEIDVDMEESMELAQAAIESINSRAREIAMEAIGNQDSQEYRETAEAARLRLMEGYMEKERKKREKERGEKEKAKEDERRKKREEESEKTRRSFQERVEKRREEEKRKRRMEENRNPIVTSTIRPLRRIEDSDGEGTEEDESERERVERRSREKQKKGWGEEKRRREEEESEEERKKRREGRDKKRREQTERRGRSTTPREERRQSRASGISNGSGESGGSGERRERSESRERAESRTGSLREKVANS